MIAQERRDRRTIRVFLNRQRSRFLSSRHFSTARIENKTNPRRIILPLDKYSSKLHPSFMHTNRKYFQKLDYSLNLHLPRSSETMIDDKRFERLAKTKKWIKKATAKWRYSIILSRHFNRKKKKRNETNAKSQVVIWHCLRQRLLNIQCACSRLRRCMPIYEMSVWLCVGRVGLDFSWKLRIYWLFLLDVFSFSVLNEKKVRERERKNQAICE